MRIAVLLLLLTTSVFAADTEVKISYATPRVGDKTVRSVQNEMSVKLTITGGERAFTKAYALEETTRVAITVLDAGKVAATKIQVQYLKDDHKSTTPEGSARTSQIVEGQSYIVANTRTGKEVYLPGEKQYAPIDAAEIVLMDFAELGRMPRISALFANKVFTIGKTIEVPGKAAQGLFSDAGTLTGLTVALREVKKELGVDVAIFDVAVNFERRDGYLIYTAPLKGEIAVAVNSALPVRLSVSGELKASGTKAAEGLLPEKKADGTGTMKYVLTNELTPGAK